MFCEHPLGGGGSAIVGAPTCIVAGWGAGGEGEAAWWTVRCSHACGCLPPLPVASSAARRGRSSVLRGYYGVAARYHGVVGPRQYLIAQTSELTTKSRIASRFSPSAG